MDLQEALELAAKIASGKYEPDELDQFLRFMDSADSGQTNQILKVYKESLDRLENYQLHVNADFIDRLRALRPENSPASISGNSAVEMKKKPGWISRVAAAAAILIISAGTYFYLNNRSAKQNTIAQAPVPTDIKAPQTNRAT